MKHLLRRACLTFMHVSQALPPGCPCMVGPSKQDSASFASFSSGPATSATATATDETERLCLGLTPEQRSGRPADVRGGRRVALRVGNQRGLEALCSCVRVCVGRVIGGADGKRRELKVDMGQKVQIRDGLNQQNVRPHSADGQRWERKRDACVEGSGCQARLEAVRLRAQRKCGSEERGGAAQKKRMLGVGSYGPGRSKWAGWHWADEAGAVGAMVAGPWLLRQPPKLRWWAWSSIVET
ncbi:hypothetical protein PMIN07_004887 [Paraphaeosphaeria minitans]